MAHPGVPKALEEGIVRQSYQEGSSTQHLRSLVPKAIKGMVFGTKDVKNWVLGPAGVESF